MLSPQPSAQPALSDLTSIIADDVHCQLPGKRSDKAGCADG